MGQRRELLRSSIHSKRMPERAKPEILSDDGGISTDTQEKKNLKGLSADLEWHARWSFCTLRNLLLASASGFLV
jgi:hypothetical protein